VTKWNPALHVFLLQIQILTIIIVKFSRGQVGKETKNNKVEQQHNEETNQQWKNIHFYCM